MTCLDRQTDSIFYFVAKIKILIKKENNKQKIDRQIIRISFCDGEDAKDLTVIESSSHPVSGKMNDDQKILG